MKRGGHSLTAGRSRASGHPLSSSSPCSLLGGPSSHLLTGFSVPMLAEEYLGYVAEVQGGLKSPAFTQEAPRCWVTSWQHYGHQDLSVFCVPTLGHAETSVAPDARGGHRTGHYLRGKHPPPLVLHSLYQYQPGEWTFLETPAVFPGDTLGNKE